MMAKKGKSKPRRKARINAGKPNLKYLGLVRGRMVYNEKRGERPTAIIVRRLLTRRAVEVCVQGVHGPYLTFWRMENTHLHSRRIHIR